MTQTEERYPPRSESDWRESVLDFALSGSPVVFYVADRETGSKVAFISPNVVAVTGHHAAAFTDDPTFWRSRIHPDDLDDYLEALRALEFSDDATAEYRFKTSAGEYRWFQDRLHVNRPGNGHPDELVGCMTDVTDQREALARLRDTESLTATITDASLDAIVVFDDSGTIIDFNPMAEQTFGYDRDTAIGQNAIDLLIPEQYREKNAEFMRQFRESGESPLLNRTVELKAMRSDGSSFPVEAKLWTVTLAGQRIGVAELWDITERITAEREQERLLQLLDDAVGSIPNGFAIYDSDEVLTLCNNAYARFFGKSPEAMIGTRMADNNSLAYPHLSAWDGNPVDGSESDRQGCLDRLRQADAEPIEMRLKNGQWKQITSHPTGDGGRVFVRTDITRLKQAEASLRKSEQQFRQIVERCPLAVAVTDVETGEILYESPTSAALYGVSWPADEPRWISNRYADPDDREAYLEAIREHGEVDNYEIEMKKADGTRFWISATARTFVREGRPAIIANNIDLTERRQQESALRQAREVLEDAIESLAEGFALYDSDDRLVMCNERYREVNEQSADVLAPGVKWADFIRTGAERGQYVDAVGRVGEWIEDRRLQRVGEAADQELEQSDGRWFRFSNRRTRTGGTVAMRTDITSHKQLEQALRNSENLIRHVVESNPLPLSMCRHDDGSIIYESPAYKALFGRDSASTDATNAPDNYVNPEHRLDLLSRLQRKRSVDDFETRLKRSDGTVFWASISGRLIEYQGEDVIVSSIVDLTERKAVEEEMARQRDALHQSEKLSALGSLLAGVAHELNNPLSVVVGQALLLNETAEDPRTSARAAKISNAADRCSRIVRTFLAMARQQPSECAAISINDIVEATLEVTGYALRSAGIEVQLELTDDLPAIWADADQVNQVVTNLILNAQQAMAEQQGARRLTVTSAHDADRNEVQLSVIDSGPGIPPHIRSRIFEPFFTTKAHGEGTGIGLAVSHKIVESLGGKIAVRSKVGEGTSFIVSLPVAEPRRASAPAAEDHKPESAVCKILVIDDEPEVSDMLIDFLRKDGHDVTAAVSGKRALDLLSRHEYDIILSDLRMPDMDGPTLFETLKSLSPKLLGRIAFITGDTFSPTVSKFLAESGRPYVQKPFAPDEIRQLIADVITDTRADLFGA